LSREYTQTAMPWRCPRCNAQNIRVSLHTPIGICQKCRHELSHNDIFGVKSPFELIPKPSVAKRFKLSLKQNGFTFSYSHFWLPGFLLFGLISVGWVYMIFAEFYVSPIPFIGILFLFLLGLPILVVALICLLGRHRLSAADNKAKLLLNIGVPLFWKRFQWSDIIKVDVEIGSHVLHIITDRKMHKPLWTMMWVKNEHAWTFRNIANILIDLHLWWTEEQERLHKSEERMLSDSLERRYSKDTDKEESVAIPDSLSTNYLLAKMANPDPATRVKSAIAFGQLGKDALCEIEKIIHDNNKYLRSSAAIVLGNISSGKETAAQLLGQLLRDKSLLVRYSAAVGASYLGSHAIPLLPDMIKVLNEADKSVWYNLQLSSDINHLSVDIDRLGKEAVPRLISILHESDDVGVKKHAISSLRVFKSESKKIIPELLPLLKDRKLVQSVLTTLGSFDADAAVAVPEIIPFINAGEHETRRAAAMALGNIGRAAQSAVPALVEHVRDKKPQVREHVAIVLAQIKADSADAINELYKSIKRRIGLLARIRRALTFSNKVFFEEMALHAAMRSLVALDKRNPVTATLLCRIVGHPLSADRETRQLAAMLLGEMGDLAKPAIPALSRMLKYKNSKYTRIACHVLGEIGEIPSSILPDIISLLDSDDEHEKEDAILALGRMKVAIPEEGILKLREISKSDRAMFRWAAVISLSRLGFSTQNIIPEFIDILAKKYQSPDDMEDEEFSKVLHFYNKTISHLDGLGSRAKELVPHVIKLIEGNEKYICRGGVEFLRKVAPDDPAVRALFIDLQRHPNSQVGQEVERFLRDNI